MEISVVFPFDKDIPDVRDTAGIHPYSTFNSATERRRELFAIVAMGRNGEIGFNGDMPWHLPEDLKHFKELTTGHPVIMGRTTWLSIPRRPLPGRRNIVLSNNPDFIPEGAEKAGSLESAIALCPPPETPFIIGGGKVYAEALPRLTKIFVTRIEADFPEADTYFPTLDAKEWKCAECSEEFVSKTGLTYRFETYESRNNK